MFLYIHRSVSVRRSVSDFVDSLFKHWYPVGLGWVKILYPSTELLSHAFWVCPQLENIHLNENNK